MGDDDAGELGGGEEVFEPLDAFEVEVVGGLVEEENFGVGNEGFGNSKALPPAAAEGGRFAAHAGIGGGVVVDESSPAQGFAEALLAVGLRDGGAVEGGFGDLADGEAGGEIGKLVDVADAGSLAEGDFARVGFLLGGEDSKERGLPCSVGTDEADAVAVVNGEGDVVEERECAEAFGDVLGDEDRRHVFSLWGGFVLKACGRIL